MDKVWQQGRTGKDKADKGVVCPRFSKISKEHEVPSFHDIGLRSNLPTQGLLAQKISPNLSKRTSVNFYIGIWARSIA
jgi:hypothetical protein